MKAFEDDIRTSATWTYVAGLLLSCAVGCGGDLPDVVGGGGSSLDLPGVLGLAPPTDCREGGCVTTCDRESSSCDMTCPEGGCTFNCTDEGSCDMDCAGGGCEIVCDGASTCDASCEGGGCSLDCSSESTCSLACEGGDCSSSCIGATCEVFCGPGGCHEGVVSEGNAADPASSPFLWEEMPFDVEPEASEWALTCEGATFVRFDDGLELFVGVRRCSETRYKILLSETKVGPYHHLGDTEGVGEDHCELVNAAFPAGEDDDEVFANCSGCSVGPFISGGIAPGFIRARARQPFYAVTWPTTDLLTPGYYECGVTVP